MTSELAKFGSNTHLFSANSLFIEELYQRYLQNPQGVEPEWRQFFNQMGDDIHTIARESKGPSWAPKKSGVIGRVSEEELAAKAAKAKKDGKPAAGGFDEAAMREEAMRSVRALMLIRAFRVRGHLHAQVDPLGMDQKPSHAELMPESYGFNEADYSRPIFLGGVLGMQTATLSEILSILHQTYCSTIGVEFMHIQYPEQKAWIQARIENAAGNFQLSAEEKKYILEKLIEVEAFEAFLHVKYPGTKRFSIQGGDAMVPGLEAALFRSAELGVEEVVIGMPHRGRMNVLTAIMGKPYIELLSVFHGNLDFPQEIESSGDVKYHLGVSSDRDMPGGKRVHLSLNANPSHLEAVNPVVVGRVRAKQAQLGDAERSRVMGVLLHGDAAFAGQGVVAETFALSDLPGYRTGGTFHLIVNNQIGFTTNPVFGRSSPYSSDVAKVVQAPIFHVNGDDPEAVAYACKLAAEFRAEFKRDVVIDMFCYRKYGHNEGDEPMFTQPLMYKAISQHKLPAAIYAERLKAEGVVDDSWVAKMFERYKTMFEKDYEAAKTFKANKADWLGGKWSGYEPGKSTDAEPATGVDVKKLKDIGLAIAKKPEGITVNAKLVRFLEARKKMMETGEGIDWATAEALAFCSLLKEGHPVRLSGQDCERATFSQRHSTIICQDTEQKYYPYNHLGGEQANYEVYNSNLSEYAVMGFEYGYSTTDPNALVMWEAQFGDFFNGAQIIVDQFIASGEIKWLRMSGLVLLLPHGFEGNGPEHSSARLERFLQMCAQDNMQVANCSTPANYFHILRRQIERKYRKPLVLMTPKSLLRHKLCVSRLDELGKGTCFQRIIPETEKLVADDKIKRVILCSGKVYYDLLEGRMAKKINDIALLRVEQFYPYPHNDLVKELKRYKNAEIMWCQEEPKNMGAWWYMHPQLEESIVEAKIKAQRPRYSGRRAAASPATGYLKIHQQEQQQVVDEALG